MHRIRRHFPWLLVAAVLCAGPLARAADRNPGDVSFLTGPQSGQPLNIALGYLRGQAAGLGLSQNDLGELAVSAEYKTAGTGVTHLHFQQRHQGIDIWNGVLAINVAHDGSIINLGDRAIRGAGPAASGQNALLTARDAVAAAAAHLRLRPTSALAVREVSPGSDQAVVFSGGGISSEDIRARLVWQPLKFGRIRLAWNVTIVPKDRSHWWNVRIDARTGAVLDRNDWVVNEALEPEADSGQAPRAAASPVRSGQQQASVLASPSPVPDGSSYQVYALPDESPSHAEPASPDDGRTLVSQPADATASPYGWHDTDGAAGAEFTSTQGNNVLAATDTDADNLPDPGSSPDGGAGLSFAFPLDLTLEPGAYRPAAVTNLFYWNNLMHDVNYLHGFTEAAGNFQVNNYGRGGAGDDAVQAEAQDGSGTDNANFATPPDGIRPRMQMYIWTATTPARDSDFDSGVITHEYGHGISNRLTGGPSNSSCLAALESAGMGEGWSDWMSLIFTMQPGDTPSKARGVGTYLLGQPAGGTGIRDFPYSTDLTVDPRTYATTRANAEVHAVGSVWTAMLWEMNWALIARYGFNPDLYGDWTTGGNNLAHRLVLDGMQLQPCSPGFVDGRNAILSADLALTGGANQCEIWKAFARRGLGFSATQGSVDSDADNSAAFDLPASCLFLEVTPPAVTLCAGTTSSATNSVRLGASWTSPPVGLSASGYPAGSSVNFTPDSVATVPASCTCTLGGLDSVPAGTYAITLHGADGADQKDLIAILNLVTLPPGPVLAVPAEGASNLIFSPPLFWRGVAGATGYEVEVDDDADFSSIVFSTTTSAAVTGAAPTGLTGGTTYHWRVRSTNVCGAGANPAARSFSTVACGPAAPAPSAPRDGAVDQTLIEKLTWSAVPGATGYVVEVDDDPDFTSIDFTTSTSATTATTPQLAGSTLYYWRVRSTTACGQGANSAPPRSFLTVACGPAAPSTLAPANGSTGLSPLAVLSWSAVPGATGYVVELDDDPAFTSLDYTIPTAATSAATPPLSGATRYYWRVRSTTACGQGPPTEASSFATQAAFCQAPNLPIADTAPAVGVLQVPAGGTLSDLDLFIDAAHPFVYNLKLTLTHIESGVSLVVMQNPDCGAADLTVTLDDEGTDGSVQNQCRVSPPSLFGRLTPAGPLATFDGQPQAGTWQLRAENLLAFDDPAGTLRAWCLLPTSSVCGNGIREGAEACDGGACCAPDCSFAAAGFACADDGNPCTQDLCSGGGACTHPASTAPCDDGDPCTLDDVCGGGACRPGPARNCYDGNPCTDDRCDPAAPGACVHTPNASPCADDGVGCTSDVCAGGICTHPPAAVLCGDGNACTADGCDPASGCTHTPTPGAACSDNNACTTSDACSAAGACAGGAPLICDDGNPCTTDACDPATGCSHLNNANTCSDGNACTTNDRCSGGSCAGGPPLVCPAPDQCHSAGTCNAATGQCSNPARANGAACNDGNACTTGESCQSGVCTGGIGGATSSLNVRVNSSSDDAEESASGSMSLSSSDLELTFDGSTQTVGMRFNGLGIPKGATITSAWIQLAAKETQAEITNLTIQAQAADSAPGFTSSSRNVSSRLPAGAPVPWSPDPWTISGEAGTKQMTPELKALLQAVVDRLGWTSGNSLAIIIKGTGHRTAYSYDGRSSSAPLLHVEWTSCGGPPPPVNQPPDGRIDTPSGNVSITAGQSVNFTGTGSDPDQNTPLSFLWSFGGGAASRTLEDPGSVSFPTAGTYTVVFTARDSLGLADPTPDTRVIRVDPALATPQTLERRVASSRDDAEQGGSSVSLTSSDLELVVDGSTTQTVGIRFANITIPQGRTIQKAWIQFTAKETQSEPTNLTLRVQASDSAPSFTSTSNDITSRALTGSVPWLALPAWASVGQAGANQQTPEIKALIQAVVSRPTWVSGNALVIVITGTGHRTARSFDGSDSDAPLLHVEY